MRNRNRLIAVSVLSCLLNMLLPPTCEAGCGLFDWLFRRNRTQNAVATASANPVNAVTAGYAPAANCGPGFCQQTVVRYMPQTAYRTAYQPVPVTTYKTSTSINPANGLPITCTRPCTSYTYQARRVPYTTYRPVYTTVPVADPSIASVAAAPSYSYGYQPTAGGSSCQTGVNGSPGYTPGNGNLAPAPADFAPSLQNTLRPDPTGATPWQPVAPSPSSYAYGGAAAPSSSNDNSVPWQPVPPGGVPPRGYDSASQAPSLLESESSQQRALKPVPLPDSIRRSYYNNDENAAESGPQSQPSAASSLFSTPYAGDRRTTREPDAQRFGGGGTQPELHAPSNQEAVQQSYNPRWNSGYRPGAVKDLDRTPPSQSNPRPWPASEDKTAQVPRENVSVASQSQRRSTRYAAIPIDWRTSGRNLQQQPSRQIEPKSRQRSTEWVSR